MNREGYIEMLKSLAKYVSDNAEDYIGKWDGTSELSIEITLSRKEVPSIHLSRTNTVMEANRIMFEKVYDTPVYNANTEDKA